MKKLVVTMLTLLTCGALQALPVRNPSEASIFTNGISCEGNDCCNIWDPCFKWLDAWSIRVGFDGNYVFNRYLEVDAGGNEGKDLEATRIFTNAGYMVFNLCNRLDIFGTLGATTIEMDLDGRVLNDDVRALLDPSFTYLDTLTFNPAFSWSAGGRLTLLECGCAAIGVEGEYFRTIPAVNYLRGAANILYSLDQFKATYSEWQVGLGLSYTIATSCPNLAYVPYITVAWSGAKMTSTDLGPNVVSGAVGPLFLPALKNRKLWSYAVGTTFTLCDVVGVNVEGRFGSESACSVNGQFRF